MTPTEQARQWRWVRSWHEAGHAIVNIALGGTPGDAVLLPGAAAGGLMRGGYNLQGAHLAILCAAGPAAAVFAEQFPPPEDSEADRAADATAFGIAPEAPLPEPEIAERRQQHGEGASDERRIALWAIEGHENDPAAWAPRVEWARYQARGIVADNARLVLPTARRLFLAGHVSRLDLLLLSAPRDVPAAIPPLAEPAFSERPEAARS